MTEIERMFENAGVPKKQCKDYSCIVCEQNNNCEKYPPFTADKQLELLRWLSKRQINSYPLIHGWINRSFQEKLAKYFNDLWQSLTDQEKEEIRNILK